jgi:hypothetical protein
MPVLLRLCLPYHGALINKKERGIHITALMIIATVTYALLATLPESQLHGKYACMVCLLILIRPNLI